MTAGPAWAFCVADDEDLDDELLPLEIYSAQAGRSLGNYIDAIARGEELWLAAEPAVLTLQIAYDQIPECAEGQIGFVSLTMALDKFGRSYQYEPENLRIVLDEGPSLPVEQQFLNSSSNRRSSPAPEAAQLAEALHRWASIPAVDVRYNSSYDGPAQQARQSVSYQLGGDLLKASYSALGAHGPGSDRYSVRFFRDPYHPIRGFSGPIKHFEVGDIRGLSTALVAGGGSGVGLKFGNQDFSETELGGRITLDGDLPADWRAQLFQNGALIDVIEQSSELRYRFEDIALQFGVNRFRIVLLGPDGESKEEIREIAYNQSNRSRPLRWSGSFLQPGKRVLGDQTGYEGDTQYGAQLSYDWSAAVSQHVAISHFRSATGLNQTLGSLALNWRIRRVLLSLTGAMESRDQGRAGEVRMSFPVGLGLVNLAHTEIDRLSTISEAASPNPVVSRSTFRFLSRLPVLGQINISARLNLSETRLENGAGSTSTDAQFSAGRGRLRLVNSISSPTGTAWTHRLTALYGDQYFSVQANTSSRLDDGWQLQTANLSFRFSNHWRRFTSLDLTYRDGQGPSARLRVNNRFKAVKLGGSLGWGPQGDWQAGISLGFSLAASMSPRTWFISSDPVATSGILAVAPFMDKDSDGTWDPEERSLDGLVFDFVPQRSPNSSLPPHVLPLSAGHGRPVLISVRDDQDPFLTADRINKRYVGRPGLIRTVHVAMQATGEVETALFRISGKRREGIAGVPVLIRSLDGEEVKRTYSEFDGMVLFSNAPLGCYWLEPNNTVLLAIGLRPVAAVPFELKDSGDLAELPAWTFSRVVAGETYVAPDRPRHPCADAKEPSLD